MDLEAALEQFDRAEVNSQRLENIWSDYVAGWPTEIAFGLDTSESDGLRRDWDRFVESLPAVDGFKPEPGLMSYDEISMLRHEAREYGDLSLESQLYALDVPERPAGNLATTDTNFGPLEGGWYVVPLRQRLPRSTIFFRQRGR